MGNRTSDHLYLWSGLLLFLGHGGRNNDWHSHYAASLLITPDAPFRLETRKGKFQCQAALLPPNTENRIEVRSRLLAIMVDPDGAAYIPLARLLDGPVWTMERMNNHPGLQRQVDEMFTHPPEKELAQDAIENLVETLTGERPEPRRHDLDPRIQRTLRRIREALPDEIPAETLAAEAGLSKSRFMHLFKAQLGLPIGHYLLWRRLYESVRLWHEGMSMTDAAHTAGFYDQPHYTRTMRRMLDVTPSEIARNPDLKIHHCWRDEEAASTTTMTE